jgi:hypothetical protein
VLEVHWTTPIYHDGHLYAFSGRNEADARFRCVELRTGTLKWERDESWSARQSRTPTVYGRGAAILADGKLLVLGEGGRLGLFRANAAQPEELARWQVPSLHFPCWTGPVLAQRRLYLRSEDRLVCLDLADGVSAAHSALAAPTHADLPAREGCALSAPHQSPHPHPAQATGATPSGQPGGL